VTTPDLTGKRVLLVGAETDLGAEIARALADASASLALIAASNDPQTAFAVQRLARKLGAPVSQAIDATNEMAVRVMVRQVSKELGGLQAIVYYEPPRDLLLVPVTDPVAIEKAIRERKTPAFPLLKYGGRELDKQGGGPLVLIGSALWFGYAPNEEPPTWWLVEIERSGRSNEEVAKRVVRAVRRGKPRLWLRVLYWRTIGRVVRFLRGFTDYQYR
jgi:hypothetical protein